jgi:hypothetical protein
VGNGKKNGDFMLMASEVSIQNNIISSTSKTGDMSAKSIIPCPHSSPKGIGN